MPERLVEALPEGVFIANEVFDGSQQTYATGQPDAGAGGLYRPFLRLRSQHPGPLRTLFVYTEGAGEIELALSTGFPGGHYPCMDRQTGEARFEMGPRRLLRTTAVPGWRAVDLAQPEVVLQAYEDIFVTFVQRGDARVKLIEPVPTGVPRDYELWGGLIANDAALECFPSMGPIEGPGGVSMVWLARLHQDPSEQLSPQERGFELSDGLPDGGRQYAFADVDGDGDPDLAVSGRLFINDGGRFSDATEAAGLAGVGGQTVWADYDNDGHPDLLSVGSRARLFHNQGDATFVEVTEESGVVIEASTEGVAWLDYDGDGLLDFYAASYGTLEDREVPERDYLFRNLGDGRFEDATRAAGLPITPRQGRLYNGRTVAPADYDGDGTMDIYVGNYRLWANFLWRNGPEGYADVAADAGVAGILNRDLSWQTYGHTIGAAWGDLDGDGWLDLLVANLAHPRFIEFSDPTVVYINQADGTFEGRYAPDAGILYDETHSDALLADFDNDGDLDAYLTSVYEGRRAYLYANDGQGRFSDRTYAAGVLALNGWGSAAADVDADGDLDLVSGGLFLNRGTPGQHYLQVHLSGGARPGDLDGWSNRDAVGAQVVLQVGERTLIQQVSGGRGLSCQDSRVLHFGLGPAEQVETLEVRWPSGRRQLLEAVQAGQRVEVDERALQGAAGS